MTSASERVSANLFTPFRLTTRTDVCCLPRLTVAVSFDQPPAPRHRPVDNSGHFGQTFRAHRCASLTAAFGSRAGPTGRSDTTWAGIGVALAPAYPSLSATSRLATG